VREGLDWMTSLLELGSDELSETRARAYTALGGLAYWTSDPEVAESAYSTALDMYRELGDDIGVAEALYDHAFAAGLSGDMEETRRRMDAALDAARQVGSPMLVAQNQIGLAVNAWMAGETAPAVTMLEEAVAVFRESGSPFHISWGVGTLGQVYLQLGQIEEGRAAFLESLEMSGNMRNLAAVIAGLETLATVASSLGRHLEATRLAGAVDALEEETGNKSPLPDFARADLDGARATLGPESFTIAFEDGRRMTTEEAVDYAIQLLEDL
jgi:tetratricopeptide (TPR) repeat protein